MPGKRPPIMSRWKQAIAAFLDAALCALSGSSASAQASGIGQARTLVQSVVGRITLGHVIGTYVDLPLTLRACEDENQRHASYETLQSVVRGLWPDSAKRTSLCRPIVGKFEHVGSRDGRMTFQLPQDRCPDIQITVSKALNDLRGDVYRSLWDRRAQLRVIDVVKKTAWGRTVKVFDTRVPLDDVRHQFPSTAFPTGRYYDFTVEDCRTDGGAATMTILMRKL